MNNYEFITENPTKYTPKSEDNYQLYPREDS